MKFSSIKKKLMEGMRRKLYYKMSTSINSLRDFNLLRWRPRKGRLEKKYNKRIKKKKFIPVMSGVKMKGWKLRMN